MTKTDMTGALMGANAVSTLTQSFLSNTQNVSKNQNMSFADTLSQTTDGISEPQKTTKEPAMTKTQVGNSNVNVKEDRGAAKDIRSLDDTQKSEFADNTLDKAQKVFDKVKEVLDVSDDELNEAMEVLALSMTDLFDPANIQNLVMEVTETDDSVSLLTDVDLYSQVKEITSFADEMLTQLSDETGIDKEELKTFIGEDFKELLTSIENAQVEIPTEEPVAEAPETEVKVTAEKPEIKETEAKPEKTEVTDEQLEKITKDITPEKTEPVIKDLAEDEKPDTDLAMNPLNDVKDDTLKDTGVKIEINGQKAGNNKNNDRLSQNNEQAVQQPVINNQPAVTVEELMHTVESYRDIDAQDIFRQITDFVRVNITAESTNLEMQLHPASLGTVNMQINSTNGQITAHLTVQNELVKAVLETQLVQLQQTFAEQGTRVEAIEVTVANYNLDSSMSGNTDAGEGQSSKGNGTRRRNINLNVDSAFDEFTDEEKLMAEVMDMNGNSVDFTA